MQAVKAYYNGIAFVPLAPVKVKHNQAAIITILDDEAPKKHFADFFGSLSTQSYDEMMEAIQDTKRVDSCEW